MTRHSNKLIGARALALILMSGTAAIAGPSGTVAFLMPDQGSTRYEQHDFPGFKAEMNKLCPDCKVLYQNANGDVTQQQQQFNSVISQGSEGDRSRPGGFDGRRLFGPPSAEPGSQGDRL